MYRTYESLAAFADDSLKLHTGVDSDGAESDEWYGATFDEAIDMARHGWQEALQDALDLAESAVTMANQEHMIDTFAPVWDVSGAEVDVARYLQGEPECMIDFPLSKTSKEGRVITLVASCSVSSSIGADVITKRGQVIVALALALTRLGHSVELWVNNHTTHHGTGHCEVNVKVKGVDDEIDPSQIMFAYAHPAMLRRLLFGVREGVCERYKRKGPTLHTPEPPTRDNFPEGAIFLPELRSASNVPNADQFLRKYLGELGLLAE